MSIISEDVKSSVSTLEEVKKLQDLVRKLELQNLQLRNKQNYSRRKSTSPVKETKITKCANLPVKSEGRVTSDFQTKVPQSSLRDEYFDELEIIRISDIEMSDDESWLYTSPNSYKDKIENSYKWLRKDVDDPENKRLQMAKKALLTKLNELDVLSPENKMNSHNIESSPKSNIRRSQLYCKTTLSTANCDPVCIDSRTFTRSKKKQALDFLEKLDRYSSEKEDMYYMETGNKFESESSLDYMSGYHVLEDCSDVEEVARLQEESLRMNSPLSTPKRGSSRRFSTSRESTSDQDASEISVLSMQSTEDDPSTYSNHSSPSVSPYGSNVSLHNSSKSTAKLSGYRRSLPNLNPENAVMKQSKLKMRKDDNVHFSLKIKGPSARRIDNSAPALRKTRQDVNSSKARHSPISVLQTGHLNNESCLGISSTLCVPKIAETSEPKRVKSGLPRPARASSASRNAVRSGIPGPSGLNKRGEESWSEGCF